MIYCTSISDFAKSLQFVTTRWRNVQYFQYGSRIVENERIIGLESKVRKFGNMLCAVAEFFVAVILFTALNSILRNLSQGMGLSSLSAYRMLVESINMFAYNDALAFVLHLYNHASSIVVAITFTCVCVIAYMISIYRCVEATDAQNSTSYACAEFAQSAVSAQSVLSYRHKVCFLA